MESITECTGEHHGRIRGGLAAAAYGRGASPSNPIGLCSFSRPTLLLVASDTPCTPLQIGGYPCTENRLQHRSDSVELLGRRERNPVAVG